MLNGIDKIITSNVIFFLRFLNCRTANWFVGKSCGCQLQFLVALTSRRAGDVSIPKKSGYRPMMTGWWSSSVVAAMQSCADWWDCTTSADRQATGARCCCDGMPVAHSPGRHRFKARQPGRHGAFPSSADRPAPRINSKAKGAELGLAARQRGKPRTGPSHPASDLKHKTVRPLQHGRHDMGPSRGVTGQFADKPTRGQLSRGLVNSRTSQLAETFGLKFAVNKIAMNVICVNNDIEHFQ